MTYNIKSMMPALAAGMLLTTAIGCTDGYDDFNRNPYGATKEEMQRDAYDIAGAMNSLEAWIVPNQENTCQFTECLLGGSYGGYFADSNSGFAGKNFAQYSPANDWARVPFNDIIPKVFINYNEVKRLATDDIIPSVAEIVKVASLHRITDAYGPIPYSKVGKDGDIKAPYDTQEDVYKSMLSELDEAISKLTAHRTSDFSANADNIYGGKVEKWIKYANSLKLRLAMRMANVNPTLAKKYAEEAVAHEVGVMTSVGDNAEFTTTKNPLYVVMYMYNGGDSRVSADITSYMNGYNDPRRAAMFTKTTFENLENEYNGLRTGIAIPDGKEAHAYSNYNVKIDSKIMLMNAAEVAFLRAEGALRGWNMNGKAKDLYNEGVKLSFQQWGVTGADSYLNDATRTPSAYIDPLEQNSISAPMSSITIAWDDNAQMEENLERIITQKWIANFPLGQESWAEYRRTGYPRLMPVVVNNSGGIVDSKRGARRIYYPQEERTNNLENYKDGVKLLGGRDNMATDVWWAKKN